MSIGDVLDDAKTAIESLALTLSPTAINARNIPNTLADLVFSLSMQSTNSKKFRERSPGHIRYNHDLQVALLWRLAPLDQFSSYTKLVNVEESIIIALLTQLKMPEYRVEYTGTRRTPTTSGEYLLLEILFSVEQSGDLL